MMDKDRELMESLPKLFNIQINNTIDFLIFVDSIQVHLELYLDTTPQWILDLLEKRASLYYKQLIHCFHYNPEMIRYRAGVVMTEIVNNMMDVVDGNQSGKDFQIYAAHDFNIYSMAYAFGAEDQLPEKVMYADTLMFDLIASKNEKEEPRVKVAYFGWRNGSKLQFPLKIAGCDYQESCGISAFVKATNQLMVKEKKFEEYCTI